MKIIISILSLLLFVIFSYIIQPPIQLDSNNLSEYITFVSAIIGASGSILGGIIGGIITGLVAYYVARYQLKRDFEQTNQVQVAKKNTYRQLIFKEINTNNNALQKLDEASSTDEIKTALCYSISDQVFFSIKTEIDVDDFFVYCIKYYRILNRLMQDENIQNEDHFSIIDEEIKTLIILSEQINSYLNPTTK